MFKAILTILIWIMIVGGASATDYYVGTDGNNANVGTLSEPWQTITYAATQAQAGDTVYIKGGNYGHEHVVISNSGTASNPIVFEGYDGVPVIDGQDRTGNGININSKKYIKIKNIKVTQYEFGVRLDNSDYITIDRIIVTNIGGSGYNGWGIYLCRSDYNNVKNCIVTDARAENFQIRHSNYNLIEKCTSYGIETGNAVDYYIVVQYSHDNIIRDCVTENKHRESTKHPGHGIGIKDDYNNGYKSPHSYNNKIINCETHGHGEHFYVAHLAHDNEFINCAAYNDDLNPYHQWNHAVQIRDGAYNNNFKNFTAIGTRSGALFYDSVEAAAEGIQINYNNKFTNCIFDVTDYGVYLSYAEDNIFTNCVITGSPLLFNGNNQNSNILRNSIVFNIPYLGLSGIDITYSNFWNNGFSMPAGIGNMENDPRFVDVTNNDFHLKSQYGRWDGSGWVYDSVTSPCIDAGDSTDDYSNEPTPNGGRINIGAYGNTKEASKSYSTTPTPTPTPSVKPTMNISYTSTPVIDGLKDDWAGMSEVSFEDDSSRGSADNTADVKATWDDNYLYFAFEVADTNLQAVETVQDGAISRDDAVEIYIDTLNNDGSLMQTDDYHFLINLNNVVADLKGTGSGKDISWDCNIVSAVTMVGTLGDASDIDSGYFVELAIPWSEIGGTPLKGSVIGLDLAIGDRDSMADGYQSFDWSDLTSFAYPDGWGDAVFIDNTALILDPIGDKLVDIGSTLQFTISASDFDNDPLTYSTGILPSGASFNPTTRTFSWTPSGGQAGTYTVHFEVTDSYLNDSENIMIAVNEPIIPPTPSVKPTMNISYTSTPVIDGLNNDWAGMSEVSFEDDSSRGSADNTANVKATWDDNYLYFAFEVLDTNLQAVETVRDGAVSRDDVVEIYIDTLNNDGSLMQTDDYHFLVNLNNAVADQKGTGSGKDISWDCGIVSAVTMDGTIGDASDIDTGYFVELAIPWSDIEGTPLEGSVIGLDLAVGDRDSIDDGYQSFDWNDLTSFAYPDGWGDAVLTNDTTAISQTMNISLISITPSSTQITPGSSFTLTIPITPATPMTGAQFDLLFDSSLTTVTTVTEGNFLNQDSAPTLFNSGTINKAAGTVTNIYGSILSETSVSSGGSFATINMTAGSTTGYMDLNLANVIISDANSSAAPYTLTNAIILVDTAPELASIGAKSVDEDDTLSFTLSASDADSDSLTYSVSGLPGGASFNTASGAFSWTPVGGQAGTYVVTFEVNDGYLSDSEDVTITVNEGNHAPVITAFEPAEGSVFNEIDVITIDVTASDADDQVLTYDIKIDGVTKSTTSSYAWETDYSSAGAHTIDVTVSDGIDQVTDQHIITVNDIHPRWDVNEDGKVDILDITIVGQKYGISVEAPYPRCDVNQDGAVNVQDLSVIGYHFGETVA